MTLLTGTVPPVERDANGDRVVADNKRIAYLLDVQTVRVLDLTTGVTVATVNHDSKIDWLELNARAARRKIMRKHTFLQIGTRGPLHCAHSYGSGSLISLLVVAPQFFMTGPAAVPRQTPPAAPVRLPQAGAHDAAELLQLRAVGARVGRGGGPEPRQPERVVRKKKLLMLEPTVARCAQTNAISNP